MANIVFIHGMWSHRHVAAPLQEFLEKAGHSFFALDLPGHGEKSDDSFQKKGSLSVERYVRSVEAFILNERFETPPVIIGHSMGGLIAQLVSSRIETGPVVLLNSAAPRGINHIFLSSALTTLNVLAKPFFWKRSHKLNATLGKFGVLNRVHPEKADEILETLTPESGRSYFEIVFSWLDRSKTTQIDPETVTAPILIITGGEDKIVPPRVARKIYDLYPQADFHGFAEHGHWIFHESGSERIYQAVTDWLEALGVSSETIEDEGGSIIEPTSIHHGRPELYPTTKKVSAAKRARLIASPLDAGSFRRGAHTNAEADGGTVLPR